MFVAPFEAQLGEKYGAFNCTAVSAARAASHATSGRTEVQGERVRALTDEPIPDPDSPGLNLPQVQEALGDLGVYLEVRIGARQDTGVVSRSVTWDEYEDRRISGQGCILQVGYGPIADSPMDAGNGFRGGHAIFETLHGTYDSLADGRKAGVWKYDGRVYDRPLIERAAAQLPIPIPGLKGNKGHITHPKPGYVWAAFTRDVVPPYEARVLPLPGQTYRKVAVYTVVDGRVVKNQGQRTGGIIDPCSAPQFVRDPKVGYRELVRLEGGARKGKWIWSGFAEVKP